MKTIKDITKEEFAAMARHRHLLEYNINDQVELINLVRLFINKHQPDCLTCHGSLRQAKNDLNAFYENNKGAIQQKFIDEENERLRIIQEERDKVDLVPDFIYTKLDKARSQAKRYKNKKKKSENNNEKDIDNNEKEEGIE